MNIATEATGISTELIYDGIIIEENLRQLNKDKKWLADELKKHGLEDASEAFIVNFKSAGSLYIDKYEDHIRKSPISVITREPY